MSKIAIAVEGFVANDLTVQQTQSGHRVVNVSVPHTPQRKDETGQWVDDGPTVWTQSSFWNEHADAVLMSLEKGTLVSVTGTGVELRAWESNGKSGVNLTIVNPTISVVVRRPKRGQQAATAPHSAGTTEPWASTPPGTGFDAQTASYGSDTETPF